MRRPRFELVRSDAAQPWHARFRAANGKIRWSTEQYVKKGSALDAVHDFGRRIYSSPWPMAILTPRHGAVEVRIVDERDHA